MDTRSEGQALHDRATRGLPLSSEEQARLENWYAAQDQADAGTPDAPVPETSLGGMRSSLDQALQQLQQVSTRIQELERQNDTIRSENEVLQQRLARLPVAGRA